MNLLTHLHWLAHRQDENFMTEAFVYLLEFLQNNEPAAAVQLFSDITEEFLDVPAKKCCDVTVSTQVFTDEGRPDIEIRTPAAIVYVEVKSESGLSSTQLKRYRTSLAKSGFENTLLCLLTRYPVEDGAGGDRPDVSLRWLQVYEFLDRLTVNSEVSRYVVDQFMEFLENKGIVMDHVTWQLVDGVRSLQNLLNMIGTAIDSQGIKTKPLSGGKSYIGYYADEKKNWIGILYENPQILEFEIKSKKAFKEKDLKSCGYTEDDLNGPYEVCLSIDLASEENHFFSRDRTSQLRFLEGQIKAWRKNEQKLRELGY